MGYLVARLSESPLLAEHVEEREVPSLFMTRVFPTDAEDLRRLGCDGHPETVCDFD